MNSVADVASFSGLALEALRQACAPNDHDVLVAYHADPDGVAAATLYDAWLNLQDQPPSRQTLHIATSEFDFRTLLVRARSADSLITLDLNLYTTAGVVEQLFDSPLHVTVIDDHELKGGALHHRRRFSYLNPLQFGFEPMPPSLLCGLLLQEDSIDEIDSYRASTLARIGLLGDRALDKYDRLLHHRPTAPYKELRRCVELISTAYAVLNPSHREDQVFDTLRNWLSGSGADSSLSQYLANSIQDLLVAERELANEVAQWAARDPDAEIRGEAAGLALLQVDSPFCIVNLVASRRARQSAAPAIVVVSQQVAPELMMVELRIGGRSNGIDLTSILARIAKTVPLISYGGHTMAAGCSFVPDQYSKFTEAILDTTASDVPDTGLIVDDDQQL